MYSSGYNVQTPESGRNPRGKKRKKLDSSGEEILCSVCDIWVMGVPQYQAHVKGSRHQRRTKERSADEVINRMPFMKWDKATGIHTCEVCDVKLNSSLVVMVHVSGSRHKDNVEAYEAEHGEILTYGRPDDHKISSSTSTSDNIPLSSSGYSFNSANGTSSKKEDHERKILEQVAKKLMPINLRDAAVASNIFECKVCDIRTNSEIQLEQHMKSSKHINRLLAAKPAKTPSSKNGETVQQFQCKTCKIQFNSQIQLDQHMASEHKNNLPAPPAPSAAKSADQAPPNCLISGPTLNPSGNNTESLQPKQHNPTSSSNNESSLKDKERERQISEEVAKKMTPINLRTAAGLSIFECKVCDIRTNSKVQLEQHMLSLKHKNRLGANPAETLPSKTSEKVQQFQCKTCNIQLKSQVQLDQHVASEHKNKIPAPTNSASKPAEALPSKNGEKVQQFQCKTCKIQNNSQIQLDQHMATEHKNNLPAPPAPSAAKSADPAPPNRVTSGPSLNRSENNTTSSSNNDTSLKDGDRERQILEEVAKKLTPVNLRTAAVGLSTFECKVCDIQTNSKVQLEQHMLSSKHKNRLAANPKETLPTKTSEKAQQFQCKTCNVQVNSQIQLDQHMASDKHKYNSQHRTPSTPRNKTFSPSRYMTPSGPRYVAPSAPRYSPYSLRRP